MDCKFEELKGREVKYIKGAEKGSKEVIFVCAGGDAFRLAHNQNCCEEVWLEDICGDVKDLLNTPILLAEEVSSRDMPPIDVNCESYTWTFYKLATIKGSVTLRWFGKSNGYYSERVDFEKIENDINIYKKTHLEDRLLFSSLLIDPQTYFSVKKNVKEFVRARLSEALDKVFEKEPVALIDMRLDITFAERKNKISYHEFDNLSKEEKEDTIIFS